MKKTLFSVAISLLFVACTDSAKTDNTASSDKTEMKALYEKNLASLKASLVAFEKEDIDTWASYISDTAIWNSPAYGDTVNTKAHWKESLKGYLDNWDNLKLNNAIFLPGVDTATLSFDGSVRYYGSWDGVHISGVATKANFYGAYNFNKDGKVIFGTDFFDLGGLLNALKPMSK